MTKKTVSKAQPRIVKKNIHTAAFDTTKMDWPLFEKQRETLTVLIGKLGLGAYTASDAEIEDLVGLENLLDAISDSKDTATAAKKTAYRGSQQKFKDRFEYQDYLVEIFGAEDLLDQVVKAMGDDEAFKNFDYISQMNDINFEEEVDEGDGTQASKKRANVRPEDVQKFIDNPENFGKSKSEVDGMAYGQINDFLASRAFGSKKTAADASFDEETVKTEMAAVLKADPEDLTVTEGSDNDFEVSMGKETYRVVENEDTMETMAKNRARQDLEYDLDTFSPSFIQSHLIMTDTDRRITANDMADSQYDGWRDRDIEKEYIRVINSDVPTIGAADSAAIAAAEAKVAELQTKVEQTNAAYIAGSDDPAEEARLKAEDDAAEAELSAAEEALDDLNNAAEPDYDKMREELIEKAYDTIYAALEDPYNYFVNEQGIYSGVEDLLKSNMVSLDIDAAVEDTVSENGAIQYVNSYDGNYDTTAAGFIYWREN